MDIAEEDGILCKILLVDRKWQENDDDEKRKNQLDAVYKRGKAK